MKKIKLTRGEYTIVDDENFECLNKFKWFCSTKGYAVRNIWIPKLKKQTIIYLHREIIKTDKGLEVDHVNQNKLDNRKENLRLCTKQENQRNRKVLGLFFDKRYKLWTARISVGGKSIYLGSHKEKEKALQFRRNAEKKYFGEFASQV